MSVTVIPAEFTLNELMAYIEGEDRTVAEGFYSRKEWAEHFEVSDKKMLAILKQAKAKGLLLVSKAEKISLDDRFRIVPVYAFRAIEEVST